jgi:hypothetical protein
MIDDDDDFRYFLHMLLECAYDAPMSMSMLMTPTPTTTHTPTTMPTPMPTSMPTPLPLPTFRQLLPVVQRGSRGDIVHSCVTFSDVWKHFTTLQLTKNMRVELLRVR